jgi:hypothetical protein
LIFSKTFVWKLSHSNKNSARCYHKSTRTVNLNYPLFLSCFNVNSIFSTDFRKIFKYQISLKSIWRETSYCIRTDRQTDTDDEANGLFSKFLGMCLKVQSWLCLIMHHAIKYS